VPGPIYGSKRLDDVGYSLRGGDVAWSTEGAGEALAVADYDGDGDDDLLCRPCRKRPSSR